MRKKWFRRIYCVIFTLVMIAMFQTAVAEREFPDSFSVSAGEEISLSGYTLSIQNDESRAEAVFASSSADPIPPQQAQLRLFGVIPVKTVQVFCEEEKTVLLGGELFGVKMLCDGAIVVGITGVETAQGFVSPAKQAGFEIGDVIRTVKGEKVQNAYEFAAKLNRTGGETVPIGTLREGRELLFALTPALSLGENVYRSGMWVKDSTAGIGTVTFIEAQSGIFGGLGHGICEAESGVLIPLSSGEIEPVHLIGCKKGTAGAAGQLQGYFEGGTVGTAEKNDETGVYGTLLPGSAAGEEISVAHKQDVHRGAAQICATVQGGAPQLYEIEIERIRMDDTRRTKNLQIRVTDERLLELTGGIVQGMSGSPILQDGKLVGAVTHVFLDDPRRGYGIFAETMLQVAGLCAAA